MDESNASFSLLQLFGGFFAIVGLIGAVVFSYSTYNKYRILSSSETTKGTVLNSDVVRHSSKDVETKDDYDPSIEYKYTVNGETYQNNTVFPGGIQKSLSEQEARQMVKRHPAGKRIKIYYSTHTPSSSYLIQVGFQPTKILIAIVVILIFVGGGGTVFWKLS